MLTLFLQSLSALLLLAFAAVVLSVRRRLPADDRYRGGWGAVGTIFLFYAASAVAGGALAVAAFFAGPGTEPWDAFLRIAPGGNFGRILLAYLLSAAIALLAAGRLGARERRWLPAACVAALVGGAIMGTLQGRSGPEHFGAAALLQSAGLAAFCAVLLVALRRDALEGTLWLALAASCFAWALDTPLLAALAREGGAGIPGWVTMAVRTAFGTVAVTLVAHRLGELRAGTAPRRLVVRARAPLPRLTPP